MLTLAGIEYPLSGIRVPPVMLLIHRRAVVHRDVLLEVDWLGASSVSFWQRLFGGGTGEFYDVSRETVRRALETLL